MSARILDPAIPSRVAPVSANDEAERLVAGLSWFSRALPARMLESAWRLWQRPELTQQLGGAIDARAAAPPRVATEPAPADPEPQPASPALEIYLLSPFSVFADDRAITEWPNCKGKSIFKYLATHRAQPVPKEVLMEVFWPQAEPEAARNNLNVAIYGLRRALARADADFPFVLFRQGCYGFNPKLRLWVDAEAFTDCAQQGRAAELRGDWDAALAAYCVAQAIYRSPLLVDDRYEDWLHPLRQRLQESHLAMLQRLALRHEAQQDFAACAAVATRMLEVDACDEQAHRQLMHCYQRQGHVHLALRQYHLCVEAMARELNLIPSPQTVALAQQIRRRQLQ